MVLRGGFQAMLPLQGQQLLHGLPGSLGVLLDQLLGLAQVLVGQNVGGELDPGPGGLPRWILPCRRSSGRVLGLGPGKGEVDRPILEDRLVRVEDQQEVTRSTSPTAMP